jgi:putative two-component system response regulator
MEYRDGGLTNRVVRVSQYTKLLAAASGARPHACAVLAHAAPLYDIGKLGIPEHVLRKTGPLLPVEREEMNRHPDIGAQIIGDHADPVLATAKTVALTHHERWDGGGYPAGLSGTAIPLPGRIVALADVYEAMTTTQRHRAALPHAEVAAVIKAGARTQFDPAIVEAFCKVEGRLADVQKTYCDELDGIHELDFVENALADVRAA